jgi:peptidoglycan-associated lipoprotein
LLITQVTGKDNTPKKDLVDNKIKEKPDSLNDKNTVIFDGQKVTLGQPIALPKIYYDFDKYNIRPDAAEELNKVIRFMIQYPDAIIELSSHTDCRGTFQYNMDLSQNRAQAAIEYISKFGGIKKERMIAKGYGETKLTNKCSDGVYCSEPDHQLNRRTEFTILKIK